MSGESRHDQKRKTVGPERWHSSSEHTLFLQRTGFGSRYNTCDSRLPVTPDLIPLPSVGTYTNVYKFTHTHTHIRMQSKLNLKKM